MLTKDSKLPFFRQVAAQNSILIQTIRYYDELDLLVSIQLIHRCKTSQFPQFFRLI